MLKRVGPIAVVCLTNLGTLFAEKNVLILDIQNLDQNPSYTYLEATITEAIRAKLKDNFTFNETPQKEWRGAAKENYYIDEREFYTKNFGMQIGLLTRQDVVFGGHFQAVAQKGKKGEVLELRLFVLDIGSKKVLAQISETWAIDATMFEAVDRLAVRVANDAKSVLPNKGDAAKTGAIAENFEPTKNQISIVALAPLYAAPAAFNSTYSSETALYVKDLLAFSAAAEFVRHDVVRPNFAAFGRASLLMGSKTTQNALETKPITARYTGFGFVTGVAYKISLWRGLYALPGVGGGYQYGKINMDYSALANAPTTLSGESKTSASLNASAPVLEGILRIGFMLNRSLSIEAQGSYTQYFYSDASVGQFSAGAGVAMRL